MKRKTSKNAFVYDSDIEIRPEIHSEYINYHNLVNPDDYKYRSVIKQSKILLFDKPTSTENQKKLLFLLGHFVTSESYCILKQYLAEPKSSLKPWATLAMQDLFAAAKSKINDEEGVVVTSPLGVKGGKLRSYVLVTTVNNAVLTEIQKRILVRELTKAALWLKSEVEDIEFGKTHLLAKMLIPFDVAPQKIIDNFLDICSKKYKILRYHFMFVNTHKISKKEIHDYIKEVEILDKSK